MNVNAVASIAEINLDGKFIEEFLAVGNGRVIEFC